MGTAASSIAHRIKKPVRNFNLEQRVFKEIAKEKRQSAPRHKTTAALIDEIVRGQSEEEKKGLVRKDDALLNRLKDVYVTSEDVKVEYKPYGDNPTRPLPADRAMFEDPEFGYAEPKVVPYGKVTLRKAVEAITRHQEDPALWTTRKLALEYRLSEELTEKMLKHFHMFFLVDPGESKKKPSIANTALRGGPFTAKQLPFPSEQEQQQQQQQQQQTTTTTTNKKES